MSRHSKWHKCLPQDISLVTDAMKESDFRPDTVELEWIPKTLVETNEEIGMNVAELIEALEEHDDVSQVFSNLA